MAGAEQAVGVAEEQWVHLHIPLDPSNAAERRFGELFGALPNGMKTHFCKTILVDGMPDTETDVDMLLARLIREGRLNGKRRGRPPTKKAATPVAAAPARPAENAPSPVEPGSGAAAVQAASTAEPGAIKEFSALAGGAGWGDKTAAMKTEGSKGGTAK